MLDVKPRSGGREVAQSLPGRSEGAQALWLVMDQPRKGGTDVVQSLP
ncbi:MAG TPA: hypothetical protein VEW94_11830 [Chloroflexia bacterium]|nr:hypothetical protein [Chloroflexia bacterium]